MAARFSHPVATGDAGQLAAALGADGFALELSRFADAETETSGWRSLISAEV